MSTDATKTELPASVKRYALYLMVMAGLGGLLYGIDVGVIAAALPYIEETSTYTPQEISLVVAAVLAGSVLSSLFAGMLAEWLGRKKVIIISALLFTLSIPVICFSGGVFGLLMAGRILQGASAGLVGVVVPMYLAECLDADSRGKGTGMFQFMLTVGLVFAALIGLITTMCVGAATDVMVADTDKIIAWQVIFWCSAIPGIILFFGAFKLKESPRWLYRNGREDEALLALAANNGEEAAKEILDEMKAADAKEAADKAAMAEAAKGDTLFQRKYVIPFLLAVVVLACTQATGINSVLNYSVKIFQQAGLEGETANYADLAIKIVNMLMTIVAVTLVDKKGRTFLLKMGTLGIIVGLAGVGSMFLMVENNRVDVTPYVTKQLNKQLTAANEQGAQLAVSIEDVVKNAAADNAELVKDGKVLDGVQLIVTYNQGSDNQVVAEYYDRAAELKKLEGVQVKDAAGNVTPLVYEDKALDAGSVDLAKAKEAFLKSQTSAGEEKTLSLSDKLRKGELTLVDESKKDDIIATIQKLEKNSDRVIISPDFAAEPNFIDNICFWQDKPEVGSLKEVKIARAEVGMKPSPITGWAVTGFFVVFIAFYAAGPGVCVWLALSELMPNRIRANGMAIALLINQTVSTTIAGTFLPWVGSAGYSGVFFWLAGFTVIYFITAAFFMPETKGRTLEEIEQYFTTGKMPKRKDEEAEA
ncbi:MAG: MFS transporter [Akkermansiaceae bacterium]|nr:MFS transporter [Akkermansiaceae bacterium]